MSRRVSVPIPDGMELLTSPGTFRVHRDRTCGYRCRRCTSELRGLPTEYQAVLAFRAHTCSVEVTA